MLCVYCQNIKVNNWGKIFPSINVKVDEINVLICTLPFHIKYMLLPQTLKTTFPVVSVCQWHWEKKKKKNPNKLLTQILLKFTRLSTSLFSVLIPTESPLTEGRPLFGVCCLKLCFQEMRNAYLQIPLPLLLTGCRMERCFERMRTHAQTRTPLVLTYNRWVIYFMHQTFFILITSLQVTHEYVHACVCIREF